MPDVVKSAASLETLGNDFGVERGRRITWRMILWELEFLDTCALWLAKEVVTDIFRTLARLGLQDLDRVISYCTQNQNI